MILPERAASSHFSQTKSRLLAVLPRVAEAAELRCRSGARNPSSLQSRWTPLPWSLQPEQCKRRASLREFLTGLPLRFGILL